MDWFWRGNMKLPRLFVILALFCTFLAASASAQQERYVRLRYVEGDVTLYPADGQRPNDAAVNSPVMDGDELQTHDDGRAELAFHNGIVVRVGGNSGIRITSSYTPMTIDLLQGTLFVDSHLVGSFSDELMIQAGTAEVYLIDEGNMRVDLGQQGSVRITSIDGRSEVRANGKRVLLEAGERTYVDANSAPETPQVAEKFDDLDDWNASRMEAYASGNSEYNGSNNVDQSIYYDAYDLDNYGDWQNYSDYGNVWVPQVPYGWRPYNDGRWLYSGNSWFWVGNEPWGWAPYRYGRWGWGYDIGWYWLPGSVFGPAWVSWYDYGNYIGWSPLDYWNNPIYCNNYYNGHYYNGNYPNAVQKQKTLGSADSWTFVKKADLRASNAKRVSITSDKTKTIPIESRKVTTVPQSALVSYVLPTTTKGRSYVNDQRTIKEPGDIKNPIGIKNTEETRNVQASNDKNKTTTRTKAVETREDTTKRVTTSPTQNWEKERKTIEPRKSTSVNTVKPQYDRQSTETGHSPLQFDRDKQFQRNSTSSYQKVSPYRTFSSPYYRDRNTFGDNEERKTMVFPDRQSGENPYYSNREISPRYIDEARKFFGTFDGNHQTVTRDNKPDSSGYKRMDSPGSSGRVETGRNSGPRATTTSRSPSTSRPSNSGGEHKKPPR
jgi:Family of unknown function (DUF6600)